MNNYNLEHEFNLLGALKFDNKAYDLIDLEPEDFYSKEYGNIFRIISSIIDEGIIVDDIIIVDKSNKMNLEVDIVTVAKLQSISSANISYYADSIRRLSQRRKIEAIIPYIQEGLKKKEISELLEDISDRLDDVMKTKIQEIYHVKDVLFPVLKEIEDAYKNGYRLMGITSGYDNLDALTNGFSAGELIIIGARPSIGKTALALCMATKIAIEHGKMVGFFSCEMSKESLIKRMVSSLGSANLENIKTGMMSELSFKRTMDGFTKARTAKMIIDDTPNITLAMLKKRSRRMYKLGCQIIFVDYLTLIQYRNNNMARHERVGEVSKSLKILARELKIPIVALSQVGREAEGKMPNLANLRQSGEVEEDSDLVILMHRKRSENETTIDIVKNRNGATGKIKLMFVPQYVSFEQK